MAALTVRLRSVLWHWAVRPFLVFLVARFLYALVQGVLGVDPSQRLAQVVLGTPSAAWVEIGRWAIVGVPALLVLAAYEIWRWNQPKPTSGLLGYAPTVTVGPHASEPARTQDYLTPAGVTFKRGKKYGPPDIEIAVGETGKFVDTKSTNFYSHRRTFYFQVKNLNSKKTLTDCRAQILSVDPQSGYTGPWVLNENFSISGGDHIFIPLASYGEANEPKKFKSGDTFFILLTENTSPPALTVEHQHVVTIRVTAKDAHYREAKCLLWVGATGRFHIHQFCDEITDDPDEAVSLREASQIVYDETRHSFIAELSRTRDTMGSGNPIQNMANIVLHHVPSAIANLPASTRDDEIDHAELERLFVNDDLESVGRIGDLNARFRNVRVYRKDLIEVVAFNFRVSELGI